MSPPRRGSTSLRSSPEEAVTFFVERAKRVNAEVEPTQDVTTLCERLDRLPLALELAAARTRLLQPQAILERLEDAARPPFAQRDADPRHATLRATIAWSPRSPLPRRAEPVRELRDFRGGCTLEAAEEVCGGDLDTLASLIDKSLVRRRADASGIGPLLDARDDPRVRRREARRARCRDARSAPRPSCAKDACNRAFCGPPG